MKMRSGWILATVVVFTGLCGCGGRVTVTGRVTYQGEPVPSTEVYFQPVDGSRFSLGKTDDDGHFSLRYSRDENGAPKGRYTVRLKYAPSALELTHEAPSKVSPELKEVIDRYGDIATSPLHYDITQSAQFIEIKLE
jgi:hypothetical protein